MIAPDDYQARTEEITFEPDEEEKTVTVILEEDNAFEGPETFLAKVTTTSALVTIGNISESVAIILDEDDSNTMHVATF